jgi:hypothetical protein
MAKRQPNGVWMGSDQFEILWLQGHSGDVIADANFEAKGWRPDPSMVSRHAQELGLPARRRSHRELIPWDVAKQHRKSRVFYALMAISRARQNGGIPVSKQDAYRGKWLTDLLTTVKKTPLVVDYDPVKGFMFMLAEKTDDDITRKPSGHGEPPSPGDSPPVASLPLPLPPLPLPLSWSPGCSDRNVTSPIRYVLSSSSCSFFSALPTSRSVRRSALISHAT